MRAQTAEKEEESPNSPQELADAVCEVPNPPPAVPESINLTKCSQIPEWLLHNIANDGPPRFKIVQDYVPVTGNIVWFIHPRWRYSICTQIR